MARAQAVIARIIAETDDRPSLVSRIACEIGAEIVENIRLPGDDLNSVELSRRYSTSRTPVREALMLLEKEGLVAILPRRRPRVVTLTIDEIREIYRARAVLLELVSADVANLASPQNIAEFKRLLGEMQVGIQQNDLETYVWANVEFHDYNTRIANNRTVKRVIDSLLLRTLRIRRISLAQPTRLERSFDDHVRLVRAYEERDSNLAAALIRSNHMSALATIQVVAATRPDTFQR